MAVPDVHHGRLPGDQLAVTRKYLRGLLAAVRTAPAVGRYDISAERGRLSRQIFRLPHRERFIALGA